MTLNLTTPPAFEKVFFEFHDKYKMAGHSFGHEFTRENMKTKWHRVCRFCGRSKPQTNFKSNAHLIPEQLGNTILFSDFECHECNLRFGKYESDLAEYLGISRTLAFTRNKGRVPTFKSPDNTFSAKHGILDGEDYAVISRSDTEDGSIISNVKKGRITVTYTKKPYIPANVYKAFLKMALSIINENDVCAHYKAALNYLNNTLPLRFTSGAIVYGFESPVQLTNHPYFYLFKKKNMGEPIHTHFLMLYFQNFILGFPVPFHHKDLSFYNNKPFQIIDFPPMLPEHQHPESMTFERFFNDFNSEEKISGQKEQINITFDSNQIGVSAAYNPVTGTTEEKPFDPSAITEIIMTRHVGKVNLEQLYKTVKENSLNQ